MTHEVIILLISIGGSVFASAGFWSFVTYACNKKNSCKSAESKMLLGLGHDRILYLGSVYLKEQCITKDEYENLYDYLYLPYKELGGNGTAKKMIDDVSKLPIVSSRN